MRKFKSLSFFSILLMLGCNLYEAPPAAIIPIVPKDFLASSTYDKLIIEILYVTGFQPSTVTVDNIKAFLQQRLNKPGGITVVQNGMSPQGKDIYAPSDLIGLENVARTQHNNGSTLTVFLFFGEADYYTNLPGSKTFGLTMSTTSLVVFEKTILDFAGNPGQPSIINLESTVATHQLGHLLGLVNDGTSMQIPHVDANNPRHCDDTACLMYHDFDTNAGVAKVLASGIPVLNTNCLNDLKGNGGL